MKAEREERDEREEGKREEREEREREYDPVCMQRSEARIKEIETSRLVSSLSVCVRDLA